MPFDFAQTMKDWRHHLHANPELSRQEHATAAFVCAQLDQLGVAYTANIGGHGVVATLTRGDSSRSVGLRADMDALPITEATGATYTSQNPGVMHACGHDGHTASLLGAIKLLQDDPNWSGAIRFIFQPAEEGFGGAQAMLDDGLLQKFPMRRIFGYHNWPGLSTGTVMLHPGPVMAGAANFVITFTGHAGHAAMPHLTADPVQGAAHLIIALNAIVARNIDPLAAAVISTCTLKAGNAQNQIAETAIIGGTFRAFAPAVMQLLEARIRATAIHTAEAFGLTAEVAISGYLPPTGNRPEEAELAATAAAAAGLTVRRDMAPTMGAEDFGRFLLEIPGAYAWIGNGDSPGLHNPKFDYNDEILPIAATYLAATAKAALQAAPPPAAATLIFDNAGAPPEFDLINVSPESWGFFPIGANGFRLHPNRGTGPAARLILSLDCRNYQRLTARLRHGHAAAAPITFTISVTAEPEGTEIFRTQHTLNGGEEHDIAGEMIPHTGLCRVTFATKMASMASKNDCAWAEFIDPRFE